MPVYKVKYIDRLDDTKSKEEVSAPDFKSAYNAFTDDGKSYYGEILSIKKIIKKK